jgi:hypothetical protein
MAHNGLIQPNVTQITQFGFKMDRLWNLTGMLEAKMELPVVDTTEVVDMMVVDTVVDTMVAVVDMMVVVEVMAVVVEVTVGVEVEEIESLFLLNCFYLLYNTI